MDSPENLITRLLKRSERFFKTDMLYLARGGFWLSVGQFFSSASSLLIAIAFANLLSKDTYGMYRYVLSLFSILLIPTLTGMDTAVTQAISRGYDGVFKPAFRAKLKWGLFGVVASFGFGLYYFIQGNNTLAICFAAIAWFIPLIESFDMYNSILQGREKYREFTLYNSLTQILSAACSIIAVLFTKDLVILVLVYVIANTALNYLFLFLTLRRHQLNTETDPTAIAYGKHLSLMDVFNTTVGQLDKVLVFHYLGAVELAIYSLVIAPPDQLKGLLKNIQFLAMPRLAQRTKEEVQQTLLPRLFKFALVVAFFVLIYILIAPLAFHIFFNQYSAYVGYSQVFALSLILTAPAVIPFTFLQAHAAKRSLYAYNVSSNIVTIVVLFPCIYFFGLPGAIAARIIIRGVTFGIATVLAMKL